MSTLIDSIERSIQAFRIDGSLGFSDIKNIVTYISRLRAENPSKALLDKGNGIDFLFLSNNGALHRNNIEGLWLKFGWARRRGLPETLDAKTGRTEVLRLPTGIYLFEPSHFIIFEYNNTIILLYEFNQYAPRPTRLCQYLIEFFKQQLGKPNLNVKIYARRMFVRDVERLLEGYDTVKSISVELKASELGVLNRVLGESETILESLHRFGSSRITIGWKSDPRGELEITIGDILNMFHELEPYTTSFKVRVKRGLIGGSTQIDLKKQALAFRKRIKLARDEQGNLLRSTDTNSAIEVLADTITEVISQL